MLDPAALSVFSCRMGAICDEMGAVLQRTAFSPNIKDRLDFSCAIFDAQGQLCAQAAHIPVHLGSMAYAMAGIVQRFAWQPGDLVVVNDPYAGGTHLPDVTLITPVFHQSQLCGFVSNRAHHASIGASAPGSMPITGSLEEEGILIPPTLLGRSGHYYWERLNDPDQRLSRGDFSAQISACQIGAQRLSRLIETMGRIAFIEGLAQLNAHGERLMRQRLAQLPPGQYCFTDYLDDDGLGHQDIPIQVTVSLQGETAHIDFSGTAASVPGNLNCPLSVTAAAVYYVFRCLLPDAVPACAGLFRPIHLAAPEGSLVNAHAPSAVAAGNVETSMRITDALLGALAQVIPDQIPAAAYGSMNNVAMGGLERSRWEYYETIAGGHGAYRHGAGLSARQAHMTNTLNTPIESLELHYPLRIRRYALRTGSGGQGLYHGGDGLIREYEFLEPTQVTLLTERRSHQPWGLEGAAAGLCGENQLNDTPLPGKISLTVDAGDRLTIATPGGGGFGKAY